MNLHIPVNIKESALVQKDRVLRFSFHLVTLLRNLSTGLENNCIIIPGNYVMMLMIVHRTNSGICRGVPGWVMYHLIVKAFLYSSREIVINPFFYVVRVARSLQRVNIPL